VSLEEQLAAKDAELAARDVQIAELLARNAELEKRVDELRELIARNSSNSHLPPSSDPPGSRVEKGKKGKKGERKRGGQKGHRGATRMLLPPEKVDEFVDFYPPCCERCCASLPATLDPDARRYQLLDLCPFKPYVKEFRRHEVECPVCGHRTLAPYDSDVIPSSPFGPRLSAVVVLLTGVYHLGRNKVRRLLGELFGIELATGTISRIEARMSPALVPAVEEAQRAVEEAAVKYSDGTTWLRAGITMSLWVIACALATVYRIFDDGCADTIRPLFGKILRGILVSDRAAVFGFWAMKLRQICWAHLLRKFVAFSERDGPAGALGRELVDCACLLFDYWHAFEDGRLTREELAVWMRPLRHQTESALERAVAADIDRLSGSCANMLAHREALWTFVDHEGVKPTNNDSERDIRPFVLWRKHSYGTKSERGERFAERIMTVVYTARKQGLDVLDFLVRTFVAYQQKTTGPTLIASLV
jgi:transposase